MNADPVRRPFDHVRLAQRLQGLVGVDDRKADGVGDLRLGQRDVEKDAARQPLMGELPSGLVKF
jgi:hypothetical protein